jgi:two-component system cell cycle sensor histidine kinase/response regulator CckA
MAAAATVLVVDDEPAVLQFVCHALRCYGYEALPASDGRQALDIISRFERPIDLVLSDVAMPGIRGPDLARRIARLSPSTSVLFMSGNVGLGELPAGSHFIEKPFTLRTLYAKVDQALHGPPSPGVVEGNPRGGSG